MTALSSAAKSGIIAGSVVAGLLLLAGVCWCLYKRRMQAQMHQQNTTMLHSASMQHPQAAGASHYMPNGGHGGGVAPAAMMALVCCVALLSLASLQSAEAAGVKWESKKDELDHAWSTVISTGVCTIVIISSLLSCCCPQVLVALAAGR